MRDFSSASLAVTSTLNHDPTLLCAKGYAVCWRDRRGHVPGLSHPQELTFLGGGLLNKHR